MGFARQGQFRRPAHGTRPRSVDPAMDNEQTHEGASVWNRGNVLIGITGLWRGSSDWSAVVHPLGFLISNDGVHFREPIHDFVCVPLGEDGRDWDDAGLSQGQGFESVGDKTYLWYGQMDQREGARTGSPFKRHGGIGLITWARDRFGSLSVRDPSRIGILVTSELRVSGPARLWANVDGLGSDCRLRVELLDRREHPLSGYSERNAAVVDRSGLRVPVLWNGRERLSDLQDPIKIKVSLEGRRNDAIRFYALYVEGE
jgi:hypothetical protein